VKLGFNKSSVCKKTNRGDAESKRFNWKERTMRSIFSAVIMLLASTAVVPAAQAEKHRYAQAFISHRQSVQASQDKLNGIDQAHPDEDALTKRIEQDKIRLDRLIEICAGC
jgi:hypothetical protein